MSYNELISKIQEFDPDIDDSMFASNYHHPIHEKINIIEFRKAKQLKIINLKTKGHYFLLYQESVDRSIRYGLESLAKKSLKHISNKEIRSKKENNLYETFKFVLVPILTILTLVLLRIEDPLWESFESFIRFFAIYIFFWFGISWINNKFANRSLTLESVSIMFPVDIPTLPIFQDLLGKDIFTGKLHLVDQRLRFLTFDRESSYQVAVFDYIKWLETNQEKSLQKELEIKETLAKADEIIAKNRSKREKLVSSLRAETSFDEDYIETITNKFGLLETELKSLSDEFLSLKKSYSESEPSFLREGQQELSKKFKDQSNDISTMQDRWLEFDTGVKTIKWVVGSIITLILLYIGWVSAFN